MDKRTATSGAALLAASALTAATVLPGGSATAEPSSHTLRLTLHETASHNLGKGDFVGTDRATTRGTSTVVGFDTVSGHFDRKAGTGVVHAALSLKGGLLIAKVHFVGEGPRFKGKITGGAGAYDGASGTARGRDAGHGKTFLTLRFTV